MSSRPFVLKIKKLFKKIFCQVNLSKALLPLFQNHSYLNKNTPCTPPLLTSLICCVYTSAYILHFKVAASQCIIAPSRLNNPSGTKPKPSRHRQPRILLPHSLNEARGEGTFNILASLSKLVLQYLEKLTPV